MASTLKLAGCILTDGHSAILLIHRNHHGRVQWEIPGGKIEPGESDIETTTREAKEELGCDIKIIRRLGDKEFEEDGKSLHYTWFSAEVVEDSPKIGEPDKYDGIGFFNQDDLERMRSELSPNTVNFLDNWRHGHFKIN
jgi:8-oxo-dGTP diphosphatase